MPFIPKAKQILWTHHARAKMAFYRLSEQRVMRVIHSPKRTEEGVAPKTVAMMQPNSVRTARAAFVSGSAPHQRAKWARKVPVKSEPVSMPGGKNAQPKEIWSQEIWVMVQDIGKQRKIVSAWRYPGMTRPRSDDSMDALRREYREFLAGKNVK